MNRTATRNLRRAYQRSRQSHPDWGATLWALGLPLALAVVVALCR